MTIKIYSLFLISVFSIMACAQQPVELKKLHEQVMAVHDEVMPKMRDMRQARKALAKIEDPSLQQQTKALIADVEKAEEGMMDWMAEFKKPDSQDKKKAKEYYHNELKEITTVKDDMLSSLEAAQQFLRKHGDKE